MGISIPGVTLPSWLTGGTTKTPGPTLNLGFKPVNTAPPASIAKKLYSGPLINPQTGASQVQDAINNGLIQSNGKPVGTPVVQPDPAPKNTAITLSSSSLEYNVGMALPSYHGGRVMTVPAGKSDVINTVNSPNDLFNGVGTQKGMISTWIPKNPDSAAPILPNGDAAPAVDIQGRFGFQFHYNPTQLRLGYSGSPDIDLGLSASDSDPFNLVGTAVSQSTIGFDIAINRTTDFAYYDPATGLLKPNVSSNLYAPKMPDTATQKRIYEYGTMYDIEYLLAALLGFKINTKYRDVTADLGYIAGRPVELFLGKKLRYLGMVTSVGVNHVQFDQRMVPTWSVVSLQFSRMPDYSDL